MAALEPFQVITASTSGKSIVFTPNAIGGTTSTSTLDSTGGFAPSLLVVNGGTTMAWMRMSTETTPAATTNDIPLPAGSVRLFANPSPAGKIQIAIVCSITTTLANVFICPGEGGI